MTPPNDWQIKKCLVLSLSLLLAMLGLIALAGLGFDVPVLRQVVGFTFLTFIPGILLLRILKIHNLGIMESMLYSVGLSLAFVMAIGVVANFALPPLGISHPIALAPFTATLAVFSLILAFLAYALDKNFRPVSPLTEGKRKVAKPSFFANLNPYLLAILLPLLAILGASLQNSYQNNTLLFALIFIVMVITGLVAFNRFIPPRVYPFMIVMMALALIYQTTLISGNLVGSDIHLEYYAGNLVIENGYWDATTPFTVNSCLSVVMLAPIYSLLLNMDVAWLLKVIYPLFFCLMPLGLFHIWRLQIKPIYAFFATLFFISMPMFTMDMTQLVRQQISELFFVLVILLMVDRKLTLIRRITLVLIFGFGVVVSHYGLGTGYIGYLILGTLVLIIVKSRPVQALWQWLIGKANSLPPDLTSAGAFNKKVLVSIVGVSLVFMLGYYGVVASGVALSGTRTATSIVLSTTEQLTGGITTPPAKPPAKPPAEIPPAEIPAPTLYPPYIRTSSGNPTVRLEWNTSTEATSHQLQVSTNGYFTNLIIDEAGLTDTYYDIGSGLDWGSTYYWRVNASSDSSISKWSKHERFRTPIGPVVELPGFIQDIIARFPMLNPLAKEPLVQTALGLDFPWASPPGKVWRIFQYLVELCLIVGFIRLIFRPGGLGKVKTEYLSLTIASVLILLGIFVLPGWSYGLGATRIFQIALLFMAPLFLFGGEVIAYGIARLARVFRRGFVSSQVNLNSPLLLQFVVLGLLIPYFVFNSGAVFELSRSRTAYIIDTPYSIALSSYRVDVTTTFTKQDTAAADWLARRMAEEDCPIYVDHHSTKLLGWQTGFVFSHKVSELTRGAEEKELSSPSYIYFRSWNTQKRALTFSTVYAGRESISFDDLPWLTQAVEKSDKIYDNGSAQVLLHR